METFKERGSTSQETSIVERTICNIILQIGISISILQLSRDLACRLFARNLEGNEFDDFLSSCLVICLKLHEEFNEAKVAKVLTRRDSNKMTSRNASPI